jgi:hypothetical protein
MGIYFKRARFVIVWLVVFLVARLILGVMKVPYAQGTWFFSMVTFSWFASLFYGAFSRQMWGYKWNRAMLQGGTIAICAQVLIFLATVGSYLVGAHTYFNDPGALGTTEAIPLGAAVLTRLGGLVVNTIAASVVGLIGWAMGGLVGGRA